MQKLRKSESKRFEAVCKTIREALHLEHWETEYTIEQKQEKDKPRLYAQHRSFIEGRRLWIGVYPAFWDLTPERQLTTLIHEHIHGLMQTLDQFIYKMVDWSHEADRRWSEMVYAKADEHVVDHLTSVVNDLIKPRF